MEQLIKQVVESSFGWVDKSMLGDLTQEAWIFVLENKNVQKQDLEELLKRKFKQIKGNYRNSNFSQIENSFEDDINVVEYISSKAIASNPWTLNKRRTRRRIFNGWSGYNYKITEKEVRDIFLKKQNNFSMQKIAKFYNMSKPNVSDILTRKIYASVKIPNNLLYVPLGLNPHRLKFLDQNKVVELRKSGMLITEIAEKLNIDQKRISCVVLREIPGIHKKLVKQSKINTALRLHKNDKVYDKSTIDRIYDQRINQKKTWAEIGIVMSMPKQTVHSLFRREFGIVAGERLSSGGRKRCETYRRVANEGSLSASND